MKIWNTVVIFVDFTEFLLEPKDSRPSNKLIVFTKIKYDLSGAINCNL